MKRRIMARFWPDDNPLSVGDFKTGSDKKIANMTLPLVYGGLLVIIEGVDVEPEMLKSIRAKLISNASSLPDDSHIIHKVPLQLHR